MNSNIYLSSTRYFVKIQDIQNETKYKDKEKKTDNVTRNHSSTYKKRVINKKYYVLM